MTPQEKAKELIDKFHLKVLDRKGTSAMNRFEVQQCALIAVDEALNVFIEVHKALQTAGLLKFSVEEAATYKYWQEVKQEIEKI